MFIGIEAKLVYFIDVFVNLLHFNQKSVLINPKPNVFNGLQTDFVYFIDVFYNRLPVI